MTGLRNSQMPAGISFKKIVINFQSGRRDSNPLPTAWEAVALPGELLPQNR
jgi:hypothetical protein